MTAPDFSHLMATPSTSNMDGVEAEPPEPDFGPDANSENAATAEQQADQPKPRAARRNGRASRPLADSFLGKTQDTKPPKTPKPPKPSIDRPLNKTDQEKIAGYYVMGGMALMPFRPNTALAMADQSEQCAAAWMEMSRKNPAVRRTILRILEGGAVTGIAVAHMPILYTLMPEELHNRFLHFVERMAAKAQPSYTDTNQAA